MTYGDITLKLMRRVSGGGNEKLGVIQSHVVPREGENIEYDGELYRIQNVVHSSGEVKLIIS